MKNLRNNLWSIAIGMVLMLMFATIANLLDVTTGDIALALIATKIASDLVD